MTDAATADLLRVDLTDHTVEREPVPDRWLAEYVGGKGLGARVLYDRGPTRWDRTTTCSSRSDHSAGSYPVKRSSPRSPARR